MLRTFLALFLVSPTAIAECPPLDLAKLHSSPATETTCYSYEFDSPSLGRKVEANVFVPKGYSTKSPRLPFAIFLHGRGGGRAQSEDIGMRDALDRSRGFVIVAPSGGSKYWVNNARGAKEKWGDAVAKDLVADIERRFHVIQNDPSARALFGISMGGAGVVQLGFNHRGVFGTGLSMSPVFRREKDIWKPGSKSEEPREDYDSFGVGADYRARSPRHLCEKSRAKDGTCLPFNQFRLDIGEGDELLNKYPDTRDFIRELKSSHPASHIQIGRCPQENCEDLAECQGHTYTYWRCALPEELKWLSDQLKRPSPNSPRSTTIR